MNRFFYDKLVSWKLKSGRKPLMLRGARQVGKTHLLKEFGRREFANCHYLNFEKNPGLAEIFVQDFETKRILNEISLRLNKTIDSAQDLLILDEIQECPKALTALKYFCEELPELAVCAAGSLLGVTLAKESFPVGKVEFLDLYPMTFAEFLMAKADDLALKALEESVSTGRISMTAHACLWTRLKEYYFVGGMPEVVQKYVRSDLTTLPLQEEIRALQHNLLDAYYKDFAKHAGKVNAVHIAAVFENVPRQLAQNLDDSVKRYRFKDILPNKRSHAELSGPIDWLVHAGLLIKTKITNRVELPLEAFCKENIFKLYFFDVGLLGCQLGLDVAAILDEKYGITKGYFSENYVATQLVAAGVSPLYAWNENTSEIEFLALLAGGPVPIEVKSGRRTHAKSFSRYLQVHKPKTAVMITANPMSVQKDRVVKKIALYQAELLRKIV